MTATNFTHMSHTDQSAYPLSWPISWPRTAGHKREASRFFSSIRKSDYSSPQPRVWNTRIKISMADVTGELLNEIRNLGATRPVISTNVELRNDGLPYANRVSPSDPGAAVYFMLKGKPCVLACDKWNRVEDNLRAISKHIEALRGQERWGVGSVEQAFSGYTALPAPGTTSLAVWWNVLGCAHDAPFEAVKDAYREQAKRCHPDANGGSHDAMTRLNTAWDQARAAFKQP